MDPQTVPPALKSWPRRHPCATAFLFLLAALVVLVLIWDWNWFKPPLERYVTGKTGREFHIDGNLDVDLGRTLTVTAEGLRFANAAWARDPEMARTQRLEMDVLAWPLLRGRALLPRLALQQPVLHLQRDDKALGNWEFERNGDGELPKFRNVRINAGLLTYFEPARKTDIKIDIDSKVRRASDAESPIAVRGGGRWNGNIFTLTGTAESPLELRDAERPYRIDMKARAGSTRAHARGQLLDPLRFRDMDLKLALAGTNLADLYPLIGLATPDTPPYTLDGRLRRDIHGSNKSTWHYDGFAGKVGDSDLSGDAAVKVGGTRPFLKATLVSRRLDFDDLAGFIGGAPAINESTNPELEARATKQGASGRVLPGRRYDLSKLRNMDADVTLKAHRINAPRLPLDDMEGHLLIDAGVVRLDPLNFGVAGGDIRSIIRMDAREKIIVTQARITASKLNLQNLLPAPDVAKDAIGKVSGEAELAGSGNSIAKMLGTSDGRAAVGMGRGQVSNLMMEMAGLDVQEALKFLLTNDRQVPIRCAWGDFKVTDGLMVSQGLAFDTSDTLILGEGSISLRDETLDLKLRPRPKDRSLLVFRAPLLLRGTFSNPSFKPELGRVALRAALALVLANIAPPAALLATFERGPGEDSSCGGRYAK